MGVLAPGTMLGGCRIEAVVGKGGMGVVYRARQLELDRDVALKVIAPELVEDPQTRTRFLTEARAAGAVEHPNVLPVHGAGIADGQAYLVMRYVAGDDLRTVVRVHGALMAAQAGAIALQLGDALDAIHRAGYVHRDVKPQNVMLDAAGHAYLSDFGLAKRTLSTEGPTGSEQWVGTIDYVAPEQIRGERVDARADVYALGGVLYFMLTGHVPFERESDQAKLWAHLVDPPPLPSAVTPGLPSELDAVLQRALAKDPAERYPSAGDLGRAARASAGRGGDTGPERMVARGAAAPATTRAARTRVAASRPGRRAWPVLAAAGLTVAAAVTALILLSRDDRGGGPRATGDPRPTATAAAAPAPAAGSVSVGRTITDVGVRPIDAAIVDGHVWVISSSLARITSIDVESGRESGPQPWIGKGAAAITRDGDVVWVAGRARRKVLGVSPRTGTVIRRITTSGPPIRVAAGPSGLWVVTRAEPLGPAVLLRYDREGDELLDQHYFEEGISDITLGGGFLWVALERQRRVMRIAPGAEPELGAWLNSPPTALAYGAGYAWASVEADDSVARIDPRDQQAVTNLAGRRPQQLVVSQGRVFVASYTDHRIVFLGRRTGERLRRSLRVPPNPHGMAAGGGHVWVTGVGTNTLTRLDY